ncbi:MAG: hypothetical protein KKC01_06160 [Gammaproteobacteria bacterium]|nr:hypothetical protein [Gammaproteobacteria bacterium]
MATAKPNPAVIPQSWQRYPESTRSADQSTIPANLTPLGLVVPAQHSSNH